MSAKKKTSLFLRTCGQNGEAYGGFVWPLTVGAMVSALDWDAKPECGSGLHGLLSGGGNASYLSTDPSSKWLVVQANTDSIVDLGGKHKFPACKILHIGDKISATEYLLDAGCTGVHFSTATAGDMGTATAGDMGTIMIKWWDAKNNRSRTETAYIGENGIKPNTKYKLDGKHQFVEVAA